MSEVCEIDKVICDTARKRQTQILDEDSYTQKIESIIERDFFPDLLKLSVQKSYFDALESNDVVKLRELQVKYGGACPTSSRMSTSCNSPKSFETPEWGSSLNDTSKGDETASDRHWTDRHSVCATKTSKSDADACVKHSLDTFLARHTSEDNASFQEILEQSELERREKHAWLFDKELTQCQENHRQLALPSIEEQAAIVDRPFNLDTWTYTPANMLMYIPEGVPYSPSELIEQRKAKQRKVVHGNTHFEERPFAWDGSKELFQKAAVQRALINQGKIGLDGKELAPNTPQVNGFKLMMTPSPMPGLDESPIMTWGEVDGTPLRLDSSGIPLSHTPGPTFKIPAAPKREKIALQLAEKASKAHRAKKQNALKEVTRNFAAASPGMSPMERLNVMSPAAQRLATKRFGVRRLTSSALQATYNTPSPRSLCGRTPPLPSSPSPRSPKKRLIGHKGSEAAYGHMTKVNGV